VVDRLEEVLGEGARIVRVEAEAVRGSGSKRIWPQWKATPDGITQRLPWLSDIDQGTKVTVAIRIETGRQMGLSGPYLFKRD